MTEMGLPQAESRLTELLGTQYNERDWADSFRAVMNAENDTLKALKSLDELTMAIFHHHITDLPASPIPTNGPQSLTSPTQLKGLEEDLQKAAKKLQKRRRIRQALTLEEMLNPVEEQEIGDSPFCFEGGIDAIVNQVQTEMGQKNAEAPGVKMVSDVEEVEEEKDWMKIGDVMKMCSTMEGLQYVSNGVIQRPLWSSPGSCTSSGFF
ncbi:hypothetical protein M422DRAFT_271581 [Sphaerobolus stellatus SS14]|uniref:Uncharacterized protein n=1 Tax=Sphaerobolus stellatus (strain SS14) TaxID=990650 RepID=A0A0C9TZP8_SPHS4|nr:hypothetical protein M422DRAFT_271581 [Sphaerobolus stellatus SS14]